MNRGRAGVSGIDDDVDSGRQCVIQFGHRIAVADPRTVEIRRVEFGVRNTSGTRSPAGRPAPTSASVNIRSDAAGRRCGRGCRPGTAVLTR